MKKLTQYLDQKNPVLSLVLINALFLLALAVLIGIFAQEDMELVAVVSIVTGLLTLILAFRVTRKK